MKVFAIRFKVEPYHLLPPIDDAGGAFLAYPSAEAAEEGRRDQARTYSFSLDNMEVIEVTPELPDQVVLGVNASAENR